MGVMKPKQLNNCPFCSSKNTLRLLQRQYKYMPINSTKIINGYWWYYWCSKCNESFTTTESDEISLKNIKQKS